MKIVIEMDDSEYKEILKDGNINYLRIIKAIKNGTPLPKGHGDLIDRKELTKYPPIWMEDKRRTGEDDAVMLLSDILKAEPIIEADKEGEQE